MFDPSLIPVAVSAVEDAQDATDRAWVSTPEVATQIPAGSRFHDDMRECARLLRACRQRGRLRRRVGPSDDGVPVEWWRPTGGGRFR